MLVLNKKNTGGEEQLFAAELEKFRPYQSRIQQTIHRQEQSIQEIIESFKRLLGSQSKFAQSSLEDLTASHQRLVARYSEAHKSYSQIRNGVQRGLQFYGDLSDIASDIATRVQKYVTARRKEGATIYAALQRGGGLAQDQQRLREQLQKMSLQSYGQAPPTPPKFPPR